MAGMMAHPEPGQHWRHVQSGRVYEVLSGNALREADLETLVIYRSDVGVWWVRPIAEFLDGRFVREDDE